MRDRLEDINMLAFVIHGMVGIRLLTLPRDIVQYAQNNGWMSILLAGLMALYSGYSFYWLSIQYPKKNISQIMEIVFGKVIGKLIMVGIAVYTIGSVSLSLRSFSDNIKLFLLDKTPLYIITAIMLFISLYCVTKGIKTMGIVFDILTPFVLLFITLLIYLASTNMDTKNLLPVFYGGVEPIFTGFREIVHPFLGIGIIGYIMPYFKEPKRVKKWIGLGVLIVTIIYGSIVAMTIMVFGSREIKELVYPTLSLIKTIQLEIEMFERAESLFMTVWIPISFTTIVTYYFSTIMNFKAMFHSTRDHVITFLLVPVFFILALLPDNASQVFYYLRLVNILAQVLTFAVLPATLLGALIQKRRLREQWVRK